MSPLRNKQVSHGKAPSRGALPVLSCRVQFALPWFWCRVFVAECDPFCAKQACLEGVQASCLSSLSSQLSSQTRWQCFLSSPDTLRKIQRTNCKQSSVKLTCLTTVRC